MPGTQRDKAANAELKARCQFRVSRCIDVPLVLSLSKDEPSARGSTSSPPAEKFVNAKAFRDSSRLYDVVA
jgi:hypothetical protein